MRERANCAQHSTLKGTTLDKNAGQKVHRRPPEKGGKLTPLLRLLILKMRYRKSKKNKKKTKIIGLNWEA